MAHPCRFGSLASSSLKVKTLMNSMLLGSYASQSRSDRLTVCQIVGTCVAGKPSDCLRDPTVRLSEREWRSLNNEKRWAFHLFIHFVSFKPKLGLLRVWVKGHSMSTSFKWRSRFTAKFLVLVMHYVVILANVIGYRGLIQRLDTIGVVIPSTLKC
jgi:hypothetical protein